MNILMISSYLPYPLFSGGHIRLYNIMKSLLKEHRVTLICEKRSYQTKEDVEEVRKIAHEVIVFDRKKQWSLENILKAGFSSYPFLLVGHANIEMRKYIAEKLSEKFDLIHIETFYVMQNLPEVTIPTVLVEHNIEYLVYERYKKTAPFFLQPLLTLDIAKIKYWEQYFWKGATKLIAVSEAEKKQMERDDVQIVPNGVDLEKFKVQSSKFKVDKEEKRILFIGDFKWIQNRDAVEWILLDIWPKIQNSKFKIQNSLKLWIVGKNIPNSIKQLINDPSVVFDENAPEKTEYIYNQADLLLAPIRVGGGTSYKILEAMASGVPVVTTKLGVEGLDVSDKKEVLIGGNEYALADNVANVLGDKELYERLVSNARKRVEEKYDWKIIVRKLEDVYESV